MENENLRGYDYKYWSWVGDQMKKGTKMTTPLNQKPKKLNRGLEKLKEAWNENPIGVCVVAAAVMTAAGKLIDSIGSYQSKKAYAEEARYRARR